MKVPVLLVFFNRKEVVLKSFEAIRNYRPTQLFLACDGARDSKLGEDAVVEDIRQTILNAIDWECEIKTLFHPHNLGCALGVYTAINWFFDNVERGVVLEDDCVVQNTFFLFMEELLERYKDDERIGTVDGANYIKSINIPHSYCFSRYKSTNGWGTWRRAWKNMDMDMIWRNTPYNSSIIANMGYRSKDIRYWNYRLKVIDKKQASAWDWQWYFTLAAYNQLSVFPKYSLVTNIGFGEGATHTTEKEIPLAYIADKEIEFPLQHPKYIVPYDEFDAAFYKNNDTLFYKIMQYIPFSIKNIIKKIVR